MAKSYKITDQEREEKSNQYKTNSMICLCICIVAFVSFAICGIFFNIAYCIVPWLLFGISGVIGTINWKRYKIISTGLLGEEIVSNTLDLLPDEYTVINNIPINYNGKQAEIDSLIISKYGLFIVETKNYQGDIIGKVTDENWIQKKKSSGGRVYENKMRNPVKQVKFQTYLLSSMLKEHGIHCWINPYVVFVGAKSVSTDSEIVFDNQENLYKKIMSKNKSIVTIDDLHKVEKLFLNA